MCDHSSRANLSPQEVEGATLLSCQLAFLAEASKNIKNNQLLFYSAQTDLLQS